MGTKNFVVKNGLTVGSANIDATTGNLSAVNANLGNLATANFYTGNGYLLTGLTAGNITGQVANALVAGTVYTAAQPNITSVGTLTALGVNGTITAVNITANTGVFTGNGNGLSSIQGTNITGTLNSTTLGNSTLYVGTTAIALNRASGAQSLTGITSIDGYAATVSTAAQPNITSVGTLTSLTVGGNATVGNLLGPHANGNSNVNIPAANGNVNISVAGTPNVVVVTGTGINVSGTLNVTGKSNLGPNNNVIITGGTSGYFLQTDGAGNLTWASAVTGTAASIANGTSNVNIPTANGNVNITAAGIANVLVVTGTGVNVAGTLNTGTGNLTSGNANLGNLAKANYFQGDGGLLTNISIAAGTSIVNGNSNVTVAANGNINISSAGIANVVVVTGTGMNVAGTLNTGSGIITGNGNGLSSLQGTNVTGTLNSTTLGNSTLYVGTTAIALNRGSGAQSLTGITSIDGYAATVSTAAQPNITSVGTLTSLTVSGNATVGNLLGPHANGNSNVNIPAANGNVNITAVGNTTLVVTGTGVNVAGTVNSTGNLSAGGELAVTGNAIVTGNLTINGTLTYINSTTLAVQDPIIQLQTGANGAAPVANSGKDVGTGLNYYDSAARVAFMGWDVSNAEFGMGSVVSITNEVVTFTTYGNLRVGNIIGNGQALTGLAGGNVTGQVGNALVAGTVYTAAQPNITSVGTLTSLGVSGAVTANTLVSNVATGTAPLTVTSTTRVPNLSVAYANVSDYGVVTTQTTGTFYPIFVNANTTANYALASNANLSFNAATGALSATLLTGTLTTAAQPNVTSLGTLTSLGVNGTVTAVNLTANTGVITGNGNGLSSLQGANLTGTIATGVLGNSTLYVGTTSIALNRASASQALTGITSIDGYAATVSTAAQPNITSVGTLTGLTISGSGTANGITVSGAITGNANASTLTGNLGLRTIASTYTDNSAAGSATIANAAIHGIGIPTLAAANTLVTATNAATFFIAGAPANGTNMSITNPYSLFVAAGNSYFASNVTFAGNILGVHANGSSNVSIPAAAGNINLSVNGTANVLVVTSTGVNVAGTLNTGSGIITGNGNGLSSLQGTNVTGTLNSTTLGNSTLYVGTTAIALNRASASQSLTGVNIDGSAGSATNAAALLQNTSTATTVYPTFTTSSANGNSQAVINTSISANLGNASITATTFVGALSGAATSATTAGTVTTAAQPNITSVGTLTSLGVSGAVTASTLVSNVATGTTPLTVTSTTRVPNLNVAYANVSDYGAVTAQTTGTYYPVFASGSTSANYALAANSALNFNVATGALSATLFTGTLTTAAQPNITSVGTLSSLTVTGNITGGNLLGIFANGTSNISIPAVNGNITVATAGSERIRVDTSGNVGIGNSAPTHKLSVTGTLNVSGNANVGNLGASQLVLTNSTVMTTFNDGGASFIFYYANGISSMGSVSVSNAVGMSISTYSNISNTDITFFASGSGKFAVTTDGANVMANLKVGNNATITGNLTAGNLIGIFANGNSNISIPAANGNITIATAGSERLRVDTSGNLGIGTNSPAQKLDVSGKIKTSGGVLPRANSITSTSTWSWNSDNYDFQAITALAVNLTISADAGTPTDGQKVLFKIVDDGTARTLTWTTGSSKAFREVGITLPTTTTVSKTLYVGCVYNSDVSRWDAISIAQQI